ncbi:MAG: hypothetical protein EOM67_16440, partial [Spirochaetia bacterium]|nr:hypothetical protein [Spirochaetia bacterium]
MALINKSEYQKDFAVLPNAIFEDKEMSLKATGLLTYALSKPPEWKIKTKDIVNRFSDGRDSVYSAIKELEELGYMIKVQDQENNGKFTEVVYEVYDTPRKTKPLPAKPFTENPQHSNTDISNTEEIPKGISNRTPPFKRSGLPGGSTEDKRFTEFWELYPKKLKKKEAREAFKKVVKTTEIYSLLKAGLEKWVKEWNQWDDEERRYIP